MTEGTFRREVAVCCGNALTRDGLICLLSTRGGFEIMVSGASLSEVMPYLREHPGMAVVVEAEGLFGDDWARLLELQSENKAKILLFGTGRAITERVAPYGSVSVNSEAGGKVFLRALMRLVEAHSEIFGVSRQVAQERRMVYGGPRPLTPREAEVASLIAKGLSNRQIAQRLELQEQSVKNLASVILAKLGCENRVQVALRLTTEPGEPVRS
ncbi:MAG: LuxR C-terminal-related transcriptional regulator [Fimbriimonadaceae bacterium]